MGNSTLLLILSIFFIISSNNIQAQDANKDSYKNHDVDALLEILINNNENVELICNNNKRLTSISLESKSLKVRLDSSSCTELMELNCSQNKLTSIDTFNCKLLNNLALSQLMHKDLSEFHYYSQFYFFKEQAFYTYPKTTNDYSEKQKTDSLSSIIRNKFEFTQANNDGSIIGEIITANIDYPINPIIFTSYVYKVILFLTKTISLSK